MAYPKIWGLAAGSSFLIEFTIRAEASLNSSLILYTGRRGASPGVGSDYLALSLENGLQTIFFTSQRDTSFGTEFEMTVCNFMSHTSLLKLMCAFYEFLDRVVFRFNLGSGEAILRSPFPVNADNNSVITVEFGHNHTSGFLTVGNHQTVIGKSPGHLNNMNSQSMLYIGAVDEELVTLPKELPQYQQFVGEMFYLLPEPLSNLYVSEFQNLISSSSCMYISGCVHRLVYQPVSGTTWMEPGYPAGTYETGRNVQQCPNAECSLSSCHNGGTCLDLGSSFR